MKIEHQMFAHHYIVTGDKDRAYKAVYPQAQGETLSIAARRLINHPDVRKYIDKEMSDAHTKLIAFRHADEQRRIAEEEATITMKRQVLRRIITGEMKQQRYFKYKDRIEIVEAELSPFAIIRAIELDSKLAMEWHNKKGAFTPQKQEPLKNGGYSLPLPPMREGHAIPICLQVDEYFKMGEEAFYEKHFGPDYLPALRAKQVQERPELAAKFRREGLRVLDRVLTQEEFWEMKGVYAYNRRLEAEQREQLRQKRDSLSGAADEFGELSPPEIMTDIQFGDPLSVPELFPGATEKTPAKEKTTAPVVRTIKISQPEEEEKLPQAALDNPYFRKPNPKLVGKVNPLSVVPVASRIKLTDEEIDNMLEEGYQVLSKDPNSIYYIPPPSAIPNDTESTKNNNQGNTEQNNDLSQTG